MWKPAMLAALPILVVLAFFMVFMSMAFPGEIVIECILIDRDTLLCLPIDIGWEV